MVSTYTKKVTKYLKEIGETSKRVLDVTKEDDIWLGVQDKEKRHSTFFSSDITFQMTNSKILVFQICDSESTDPKKIFGDFFTSFLSREVSKIYFITPQNREEYVRNICKIIKHILIKKIKVDGKKIVKYEIFGITEDPNEMKNQIMEKLIKEKITQSPLKTSPKSNKKESEPYMEEKALTEMMDYFKERTSIIEANLKRAEKELKERKRLGKKRGLKESHVIPEGYIDRNKDLEEQIKISKEQLKECEKTIEDIKKAIEDI